MLRSTLIRNLSAVAIAGTVAVGASGCVTVKAGSPNQGQNGAGGGNGRSVTPSGGGSASMAPQGASSGDPSGADSPSTDDTGDKVKYGKQGQNVSTSYYEAKINKVSDNAKSKDGYDVPASGTRYYVVNITMKNNGSDKLSMADGYGTANLDSGAPVLGTVQLDVGNDIGFKDINPGQSLTGDLVFMIPQGKNVKSVLMKPISMDHASSAEAVQIALN